MLIRCSGTNAQVSTPFSMTLDPSNTVVYLSEWTTARIRYFSLSSWRVGSLAGAGAGYANGIGSSALFKNVGGLAINSASILFAADFGNNYVRAVLPAAACLAPGTYCPAGSSSGNLLCPAGSYCAISTSGNV